TLRAAATPRPRRPGLVRRRHPPLYADVVSQITLEHVLIGSAIGLAGDGDGISGSPAHHGHSITGPGSTDSYIYAGGDSRTPVAVCMEAPPRESLPDCETSYGRRPVIMVMDSGPRAHQWLDVQANPAQPGTYQTIPDGFVAVDPAMQQAIHDHGQQAADAG